jgi:hypothetical protein
MTVIALVAAVWLVVAPLVFTFTTTAIWSNVVAAVLIAGVSLYAGLGPQRSYFVAVVGLYVAVSAFFFGLDTLPLWLNVVAGVVAVAAGYLGAREKGGGYIRPAT